jgi:hypothetical protein
VSPLRPPKRNPAERMSRRVEAGSEPSFQYPEYASVASVEFRSVQLRRVGVRCVSAPEFDEPGSDGPGLRPSLPLLFASSSEGPRSVVLASLRKLQRTARANRFERLAGRFASVELSDELRRSRPGVSRLH